MASIDIIAPNGTRLSAGTKAPKGARYRARYRTPGGASRTRTFARRVDAEQFINGTEHSKALGGYVDRSAGSVTVGKYAEGWISTRRGKDGQPLRPRTKELYRQLVRTHIAPALGGVALRDLTPERVRDWHAKLHGTTAPAKAYRLLRAIMSTAVEDELILRNPCRVKNAGVEHAPERPLPTGDEVWQLADAIDARYRALVLVAAFVGLRWGELVGLRREDVDLDDRLIHVARQAVEVDGAIVEGPPKTKAGVRTVALPSVLVPALAAHLERFVDEDGSSRVFVGPKGATPRRTHFNTVWTRARIAVGRPDLHLHDLRHYANTLAASSGASTRELMSRLGHASPAAALRYQHATAERDRTVADRINELITGREAKPVTLRVLKGA